MSNEYNASNLSVLEGLDAVRKRPAMYIGSTDSKGYMHCLWEIIDNSVDEALAGVCNKITVTLHNDDSIEVQDNGRGIPIDIESKSKLTGVELVMTKLHAGGKFDDSNYAASGGLHGVGASVVNALSIRTDVTVARSGKLHKMSFSKGIPGSFADLSNSEGLEIPSPNSIFTKSPSPGKKPTQLKIVGKVKPKETGTNIRFWIDRSIFPDAELDYEKIAARAEQTSFLLPGLTIELIDKREIALDLDGNPIHPSQKTFLSTGGIVDFANRIADDEALCETFTIKGSGEFSEIVQTLNSDNILEAKDTPRICDVEIALRWGQKYETNIKYFVNIIATPGGGTHQQGFEQGLVRAAKKAILEKSRTLKLSKKDTEDLPLNKDDILSGLTAVVLVRLKEPQFEGQTKEILGTPQVKKIVADLVNQQMYDFFIGKRRGFKQSGIDVMSKAVAEMQLRVNAKHQKEISRKKNALETSSMPAKLADCRTSEVDKSELFIVEGDSALGTAKMARNSEYQALLPIRGKILNVEKASMAQILANTEIASIIQVVGAGSGRTFQLENARYSKIVCMTDADVDGAHIRILLLTFFFRYMKPLLEDGRIYAAMPPLHRIELSNSKGKDKYIYTFTEEELQSKLRELDDAKISYKEDIQRYKGLGEMDAKQLADTTMNSEFRTLRRINITDAEKANAVFELLMGNFVPPRKEFIINGSRNLDKSLIDT